MILWLTSKHAARAERRQTDVQLMCSYMYKCVNYCKLLWFIIFTYSSLLNYVTITIKFNQAYNGKKHLELSWGITGYTPNYVLC